MLTTKLTSCKDCLDISKLTDKVNLSIAAISKDMYNNIVFALNKTCQQHLLKDLIFYKRILEYRYCNSDYAGDISLEQIYSKVLILLSKSPKSVLGECVSNPPPTPTTTTTTTSEVVADPSDITLFIESFDALENSATLEWTPAVSAVGIRKYTIRWGLAIQGNFQYSSDNGLSLTKTFLNLQDSIYHFRVTAINVLDGSVDSNTVTVDLTEVLASTTTTTSTTEDGCGVLSGTSREINCITLSGEAYSQQ